MGLAISKGLTELMGGTIYVKSEPGKGSEFSISIPLACEADAIPKPLLLPDDLHQLRVLLVDDNSINQQSVRELLELAEVVVETANDGAEAANAVANGNFHAVLMDIQMPKMNGYEATHAIRDLPDKQALPIIAMTSNAMVGDRDKCIESGMNDYVSKPIEIASLYEVLLRSIKPYSLDEKPVLLETREHEDDIDLPEYLHGININAGLRRMGGKRKLFRQMLLEFHQDYLDTAQRVQEALNQGNVEEARSLLHKIKGASCNLGADALYQATTKLESWLEPPPEKKDMVGAFRQAMEYLLDGLSVLENTSSEIMLDLPTANIDREFVGGRIYPVGCNKW